MKNKLVKFIKIIGILVSSFFVCVFFLNDKSSLIFDIGKNRCNEIREILELENINNDPENEEEEIQIPINDEWLETASNSSDDEQDIDHVIQNTQENINLLQQILLESNLLNFQSISLQNILNNENYSLVLEGESIVIYMNNISHSLFVFNTESNQLITIVSTNT